LGREKPSDFIIPDKEISRVHMSLEWDLSNIILIKDEGSRNGVFINGNLLSDQTEVLPDDNISIAGFTIKIISSNKPCLNRELSSDDSVVLDNPNSKPETSGADYLLLAGGFLLLVASIIVAFLLKF